MINYECFKWRKTQGWILIITLDVNPGICLLTGC